MRNGLLSACAALLLAITSAATAVAAPQQSFTAKDLFLTGDSEQGLVVLVNTDRATYCTPEQVTFEEDVLAWIEGGAIGDPPEAPAEPAGFGEFKYLVQQTRQGATVVRVAGSGLYAEIWQMDPDAPGIGPCLDTDDTMIRIGTGTAEFRANDNDQGGSGTRANAFGNRGIVSIVDDDGVSHRYSWIFHVSVVCHEFRCGFNNTSYR